MDAQGVPTSSLDALPGIDFDASLSPGSLRYPELFSLPQLSEVSRCIRTPSVCPTSTSLLSCTTLS